MAAIARRVLLEGLVHAIQLVRRGFQRYVELHCACSSKRVQVLVTDLADLSAGRHNRCCGDLCDLHLASLHHGRRRLCRGILFVWWHFVDSENGWLCVLFLVVWILCLQAGGPLPAGACHARVHVFHVCDVFGVGMVGISDAQEEKAGLVCVIKVRIQAQEELRGEGVRCLASTAGSVISVDSLDSTESVYFSIHHQTVLPL